MRNATSSVSAVSSSPFHEFSKQPRASIHLLEGLGVEGDAHAGTTGLDLLSLPTGTVLHLGAEALIRVTGLRNPCFQIDDFQPGLFAKVVGRDDDGRVVGKSGVMAVVVRSGTVCVGDPVTVVLPSPPFTPLDRV